MDSQEKKSIKQRKIVLLSCMFLLALLFLFGLITGTYQVSIAEIRNVVKTHLLRGDVAQLSKVYNTIIWEIRFPRVLLCILVGMALTTSGAAYQSSFRNPLVEPFILGVSAGASLGASLAILYPHLFFNVQAGAFLFSLLAVALVYFSSRVNGQNPVLNLILGGVIISSIFTAGVSLLKYISHDAALRAITFWAMGGFYYASWADVRLLTPLIFAGVFLLWRLGWKMNVLSIGDQEAQSLGIRPEWMKFIFIVLSTLMTAIAVSTVGIISWVGLMMPHAARMLVGADNRYVIPTAALLGAIYLLMCDTLARTITSAEIPVSIVTSILGAPYLFYLLRTRTRFTNAG